MDNLQIILLLLLIMFSAGLFFALSREKKKSAKLRAQLTELRGRPENEILSSGKYSELGCMCAGITHEISNPLSIILGRITHLLRSSTNETEKEGLQQIKSNAERIAKTIQSIRDYLYQTEGEVEDYLSLQEIIDKALVFYGQRMKNHGIELRIKNIDNIFVKGHRSQYEQAMLNLIGNSFDAIKDLPEKWIEISGSKSENDVQITIKDSGHGIPKEVRSRMLDPFYTTKQGKGSGLGLTLVRRIALKHGGELTYLDAPNTTFLLKLPRASGLQYHY